MTSPMATLSTSRFLFASVKVVVPRGLNTSLFLVINRFARRTTWAHGFMHAYALWLGVVLLGAVFLAAYGVIWWRRDVRAAALMVLGGLGTVVALGLNQIVGHAVKELRPYDTLHHVLVLVPRANDYSFPSDHAVVAGGLVAAVLLVTRRAPSTPPDHVANGSRFTKSMVSLAALDIVLAGLLCFARVYVGAHYPGDVVAGVLLGAIVVLAISLLRPLLYRLAGVLEPTILGRLLLRRPAQLPLGWSPE